MQQRITRGELYRLVWSEPLSKLAGRFGLSDNGLRKRCDQHNIPLPPRGFRQQLAAGRNPERVPLPDPDDDEMIVFSQAAVANARVARLEDEVFEKLLAHESHPSSDVVVRDDDIEHPVAQELLRQLRGARPDQYGGLVGSGTR